MERHIDAGPGNIFGPVLGLGLATLLLAGGLGYVVSRDPPWLAVGIDLTRPASLLLVGIAAVVTATLLRRPEAGLVGLLVIIYTNASEVAVRFHGLPSLLQSLMALLVLAVLARVVVGHDERPVWDSLLVWMILYGVVLLASSVWSDDPRLADGRLAEHLKGLLLAAVVIHLVRSPRTLRHAAWALVVSAAFLASISTIQALTGAYDVDFGGFGRIKVAQIVGTLRQPRLAGPVGDPNFYAQILIAVIPLTVAHLWDAHRRGLKLLAAYTLAVMLVALAFTYSRGGTLALGLVLLLTAIHRGMRARHLVALLLVALPLAFLVPQQFEGRLRTLLQLRQVGVASVDTSLRERALLMGTAWVMFLDHPVLGVGAGNYTARYDEYARQVGSSVSSYEDVGAERLPHSLYLEVAAETGLVGLVIFTAILILTLMRCRAAYRLFLARGDRRSAGIAAAIGLGLIGYLMSSVFLHGHYTRYLWIMVALATAGYRLARQAPAVGRAGETGRGTSS